MSSLESSKNLAGIGTILLILSFIPVVGIIGIILLLIGLKGLSEYYKDESIYKNAIWGVLFGIVGIIAGYSRHTRLINRQRIYRHDDDDTISWNRIRLANFTLGSSARFCILRAHGHVL